MFPMCRSHRSTHCLALTLFFQGVLRADDHDLLPDLTRQTRAEVFQFVGGLSGLNVVKLGDIEIAQFTDQREHFRAVVQVSAQGIGVQAPLGAVRGGVGNGDEAVRILGELFHVNHVGQVTQHVDGTDGVFAPQSLFDRPEEDGGDADEDQQVGAGIQGLDDREQGCVIQGLKIT